MRGAGQKSRLHLLRRSSPTESGILGNVHLVPCGISERVPELASGTAHEAKQEVLAFAVRKTPALYSTGAESKGLLDQCLWISRGIETTRPVVRSRAVAGVGRRLGVVVYQPSQAVSAASTGLNSVVITHGCPRTPSIIPNLEHPSRSHATRRWPST